MNESSVNTPARDNARAISVTPSYFRVAHEYLCCQSFCVCDSIVDLPADDPVPIATDECATYTLLTGCDTPFSAPKGLNILRIQTPQKDWGDTAHDNFASGLSWKQNWGELEVFQCFSSF